MSQGNALRVVIAEDEQFFRRMFAMALARENGFEIAGEAGNGVEAWELCQTQRPDLVFLDVRMPLMTGLEVLRRVRDELPGTRAVMLTGQSTAAVVREAMELGVAGVISKEDPYEVLPAALGEIRAGRNYYSPRILQALVSKETPAERGLAQLTEREHEVFRHTAKGLSIKEIASALSLSPHTVRVHRVNLMRKLGLHDAASLTRFAIEQGIA
jgi:DNA-binding NarL/FixJ family response regulator